MLTVNAVELQKHQLKGPVGYTVVGSPTIVDGIVSGFSASNYLSVAFSKQINQVTEYVIKVDKKTGWTGNKAIATMSDGRGGVAFGMRPDACWCTVLKTDDTTQNIGLVSNNAPIGYSYWLRYTYINGMVSFYISTDGRSYTLQETATVDMSKRSPSEIYIGNGMGGSENSTIDLNETYIKVNGKLWFYQPADTKYIVKDGKLVWADPRLALSGPVGYTVVGSPTIVDGVVSGFSASDYLKLTQNPSYEATDEIEWNTSFTTSNSIATEWVFAFNDPVTSTMKGIYYLASRVYVLYCPGKTLDLTYGLQTNTTYSVNFKKDSSGNLTALLKDENGNILKTATQTDANVAMSYNTRRIGLGFSTGNSGSIDLNETYIKVNNQLWFYGKNYATQNIAPVPAGYTFGNTTTPSIGYVDMRTQQFTAAPQGATIGGDE